MDRRTPPKPNGVGASVARLEDPPLVRGRGLFFGLELVRDGRPAAAEAKRLINDMRDRGVLISRIGPEDNILKMRPPMPFSIADADLLLSTLDGVLSDL